MKNSVVILAIDSDQSKFKVSSYLDPCKKSWNHYCIRHNLNLLTVTEEDQNLPHPKWQKTKIFEYSTADRILYVDADTMVRWDAPNIFDMIDENKVGVVRDNTNLFWLASSLEVYKRYFPVLDFNIDHYFNSGVMLFTRKYHEENLRKIAKFAENNKVYLNVSKLRPNAGTDQTYLNLDFQHSKVPLQFLGHTWNQHSMAKLGLFGYNWNLNDTTPHLFKEGQIFHFTGMPLEERIRLMHLTWEGTKHNYV